MITTRIIPLVLLGVTITMSGCERPFDRTPAGYADACYGGVDGAKKNWVCSDDRVVLNFEANEADWPQLNRIFSEFGQVRGFKVFDTSANRPDYIRTLEISVCDADGLFLYLNKRIYADQSLNRNGEQVTARLGTYKRDFDWKPVADQLVSEMQAKWRRPMRVEWPEQRNKDGALPDSIESCD